MGRGKEDTAEGDCLRILILRSAMEDLALGRRFYERQGEGLGDYFIESLSADIESLRLYFGIHARFCGYHRMLTGRFPYAVYYDVDGDTVRIRAVLDCRRDPTWIRSRLK